MHELTVEPARASIGVALRKDSRLELVFMRLGVALVPLVWHLLACPSAEAAQVPAEESTATAAAAATAMRPAAVGSAPAVVVAAAALPQPIPPPPPPAAAAGCQPTAATQDASANHVSAIPSQLHSVDFELPSPLLTNYGLDHFLVIPEHKLLFCYIPKVRCPSVLLSFVSRTLPAGVECQQ